MVADVSGSLEKEHEDLLYNCLWVWWREACA